MLKTLSAIHATPAFVLQLTDAALCPIAGRARALLGWVVLLGFLVMGGVPVLAQPTGCISTYTTGGTAAGGAAGLFGEYYLGTFQLQPGYGEASPNTYFSTHTPVSSRIDATVSYASQGFGSIGATTNGSGNPISFSARYRGGVYLKAGAAYTFSLTADDGAYLFVGKEATLAAPTPNNAFLKNGIVHTTRTVSRNLAVATSGLYDLQILFGQDASTSTLKLEYAGGPDNLALQTVPQTALCAGPSGEAYATNLAPNALPLTNTALYASGLTTTLSPSLAGFDLDGTVASYRVTVLPAAGALRYNNVVISTIPFTVADATLLSYTTLSGPTGTHSFQYQALDNLGLAGPAATYTLPVQSASADMATTLSAPATAPQGSLVYYTATTLNNGPALPTNPVVKIYLPANLTGVSLSNNGSYNAVTGEATFSSNTMGIAVGGFITRSVAFTMPGTAVSATASAATPNFPDPSAANNTGAAYTGPTQSADVKVALSGPTRASLQQAVTYTVVATNLGGSIATGVSLRAQVPAGLVGVVLTNGGSYNASNGQVSWPAVASIAKGSNVAYAIRFNAGVALGTIAASAAATATTADGDPAPTNNDGTNAQARISTQVVAATATLLCAAPGQDGNVTLGATSAVNTYFAGQGSVAAGASALTIGPALGLGSTAPIAAGDLLVVMQMQSADLNTDNTEAYGDGILGDNVAAGHLQTAALTAGTYEYVVASAAVPLTGGSLITTAPLMYGYASAQATASCGQRRYQIIRVPQYNNVTLSGNVAAPRWNGLTGGVLILDASGALDFAGFKLDMAGRGFRGGAGQRVVGASGTLATDYRTSAARTANANKGESLAGTPRFVNDADNFADFMAGRTATIALDTRTSGLLPGTLDDGYPNGDRGRGAPANAGAGGTDGNPTANDENTGGGGGGNAGLGGRGGNAWNSNQPMGGAGGGDFSQATASRLILGGGGGAGSNNDATVASVATFPANAGISAGSGFTSSGAAGGGIVLLRAATLSTNAGTIDVSGASMGFVATYDGSGGGGAGGSAVLLCNASNGDPNSTVAQNITMLANGGKGGSNTGAGSPHGPGGGGGEGILFASSRLNAATSLAPGINGTTYGSVPYGAGSGTAGAGQAQIGITRADVPNQIVGCPADVAVVLGSSALAATPGTTITLTITTTNTGPGTATGVVQTIRLQPNLGAVAVPTNATYDAATGLVTSSILPTLTSGQTVSSSVSFTMPTSTVLAQAAATSTGDFDARTANNDGSAANANVQITTSGDLVGRVFDDVNYGGGLGRSFATADASATGAGLASGTIGSPGTTLELYSAAGALTQTTVTGPDGYYGFAGVVPGAYTVRVVLASVKSARNPTASGVLPVLTFRTTAGADDTNYVGGEAPEKADALANTGSQTLAALTAGSATPQAITTLTLGATALTSIDFGFNFSTITNTNDAGAGSLRQFITNANALANLKLAQDAGSASGSPQPVAGIETSIFMISDGAAHPGLRAGLGNQLTNGVAHIVLNTAASGALPALTDAGTALDGTTQTRNIGNTNNLTLGVGGLVGTAATPLGQLNAPEVAVIGTPGQANSERGLTLAAAGSAVRGLAIYGFDNTTANATGADIYVTGAATSSITIAGNVLGTAASSFAAPGAGLGSTGHGIYLANLDPGFVSATISGNLIGFHGGSGIENVAAATPSSLLIENNEIRGNAQGTATAAGIRMGSYGGTVRANLLADNAGAGLDTQGTTGNVTVLGNSLTGNGMAGTLTPGLRLGGAANLVLANLISGNYGAGVLATAGATNNVISQNSLFDNGTVTSPWAGAATGQLGIDLLGPADNALTGTAAYASLDDDSDPDTGANGLLNFPVLTQVTVSSATGGTLALTGFAPAGATLEFFIADRNTPVFGQGKTYLLTLAEAGQDDQDATTGGYSGLINGLNQGVESSASRFQFRVSVAGLSPALQAALLVPGVRLTATATMASGSGAATSEFSGSAPVSIAQPLPVGLTAFTALVVGRDAHLTWHTAQELNNARFVVERSFDGTAFGALGTVAGQGSSAQPHDYAYLDAGVAVQAQNQPVYYRLQQVDTNYQATYGPVRTVRFGPPAVALGLWPNPTSDDATLDLSALPVGDYRVLVFDATGRTVYGAAAMGGGLLALPTQPWPAGLYLVRVQGAATAHTARLLRQ
jgi:uncharacterized repeat protein (TIGR01451 family)